MKIKFVGGILIAVFLGLWIIGCGSDNLVVEQSTDDSVLEPYKARQDEIARVSLATLAETTKDILATKSNLSEDELRVRIFEELVRLKKSGEEEVLAGPYVPGYDYPLSWAEFWLLVWYPWNILKTDEASDDALIEARGQWSGLSQEDTKADAFRHAYWNILLSKRIGEWWALLFTNAHETEETNVNAKRLICLA